METKENVTLKHNDIAMEFENTKKGLWLKAFNCGEVSKLNKSVPYPCFQLSVAGIPYGGNNALTEIYSALPTEMNMEDIKSNDEEIIITYKHEKLGLSVKVDMQLIKGANVIRQTTAVRNDGDSPVILTHVSSMFMNGIATDGIRPWYDEKKVKVHYCRQAWNGEGQWRNSSLSDLGLYKCTTHPGASAVHFSSQGSWSTGRLLPMAVIEDIESNKVWYFQIETSSNWHMEIGYMGSWKNDDGALCIHADAADERFGGFNLTLKPGESFTSVPVAVGCCKGNFDDAVKELTSYRRNVLKPRKAWDNEFPVVFNDYMNCLWGNPTIEKLTPKIDAAAEEGAECFCIDAGWFGDRDKSWGRMLGDWIPSKDRFDKGLESVLDYIKSKNMIPGVWLEMEVCGDESNLGKKPDSWFLMRNGVRVGGGARWFLNFENPEVRGYLHNIIDSLVSMGVGFIKNDYNACIGSGCDKGGIASSYGLIKHFEAFYSFIDEVRKKHPTLIIENCGSGGMREDYGVLSHFHIQSSSDQEDCYNFPSIAVGSLASILPEQLGIWAYPYPLVFANKDNPDILKDQKYLDMFADGEKTIFNMVTGLCGNMYLSGNPDAADEFNMSLIKEGISLYKSERSHIHNSHPVWPIGFTDINNRNSWASVGLVNDENSRVLLAVWRLQSGEEYIELPIHKWAGKKAAVKQLYPSSGFETEFYYNEDKGALTVHFKNCCQARFFEIKVL
ncbi:MAG: alpha-galactosidase [Bacillota bacterium]|nr:alpha-galactosidase [Bacillota bacterium]